MTRQNLLVLMVLLKMLKLVSIKGALHHLVAKRHLDGIIIATGSEVNWLLIRRLLLKLVCFVLFQCHHKTSLMNSMLHIKKEVLPAAVSQNVWLSKLN